jgi:hypothetical protein
VVLLPLKSLRYQSSSDCKRIVPGSMGANEFGEWVTAPAMLISEDIYFLNPGNSLQPEVKKLDVNKSKKTRILIKYFLCLGIYEFNYPRVIKSTYNC